MNFLGQLGVTGSFSRTSPVQVGSATDWKELACGSDHTMAIKSDGTLWATGSHQFGQLGLGVGSDRTTPEQVGSDNDWKQVACGWQHTIAIKEGGTLWVFGRNVENQLGDGTSTHRSSPTEIGSGLNWKHVACGRYHSLALFNYSKPMTTPTVVTESVSNINHSSVSSEGNVTDDGGSNVTARGVCWNTTGSPTIADNFTTNGSGTGSFVSNITGLTPNTQFYVRAYATNSIGTAYGNEISFTTLSPDESNFKKLSYQGLLTDKNTGLPLTGPKNFTFKIYHQSDFAETSATPLWEETHNGVLLYNGVFSVILGSYNPIDLNFKTSYCLGIFIDDSELMPRQPIVGPVYQGGGFGR